MAREINRELLDRDLKCHLQLTSWLGLLELGLVLCAKRPAVSSAAVMSGCVGCRCRAMARKSGALASGGELGCALECHDEVLGSVAFRIRWRTVWICSWSWLVESDRRWLSDLVGGAAEVFTVDGFGCAQGCRGVRRGSPDSLDSGGDWRWLFRPMGDRRFSCR